MKPLKQRASESGLRAWLILMLIGLAFGAGLLASGPVVVREGRDLAERDPPAVPQELIEDLAMGGGLDEKGVGATGSTLYGRPQNWLSRSGFRYEWAPTDLWSPRGNRDIEAIIVHVTGGGTCNGIRDYFKNNDRRVSAHFLVCDGRVVQQVEIGDAAHHAGIWGAKFDASNPMILGWYRGGINPNSVSVGIETLIACNGDHIDNFPEMRRALVELIAYLGIELELLIDRSHVLGHYQTDSVNRERDPRCGMDLDKIVAEAAQLAYGRGAPPVVEWGETSPEGNRWHIPTGEWVAPNGDRWLPADGYYTSGAARWKRQGVYEWGEVTAEGHAWNVWLSRWVSPDGKSHYDPKNPEAGWYCAVDCAPPTPPPATEPSAAAPTVPEFSAKKRENNDIVLIIPIAALPALAGVWLFILRRRSAL